MQRTPEEIKTEVKALKALKPLPPFAGRTTLLIVAAIDELEEGIDQTAEEWAEYSDSERDQIQDAHRWKRGENVPAPSTTFEGLAK